MAYCPECNSWVRVGESFCPKCGKKTVPQKADAGPNRNISILRSLAPTLGIERSSDMEEDELSIRLGRHIRRGVKGTVKDISSFSGLDESYIYQAMARSETASRLEKRAIWMAVLWGVIGINGVGHLHLGRVQKGVAFAIAGWFAIGCLVSSYFVTVRLHLPWTVIVPFLLALSGLTVWQVADALAIARAMRGVETPNVGIDRRSTYLIAMVLAWVGIGSGAAGFFYSAAKMVQYGLDPNVFSVLVAPLIVPVIALFRYREAGPLVVYAILVLCVASAYTAIVWEKESKKHE